MIKNRRTHRLGQIERDVLENLSGGDLLYGFLLSAHSSRRMFKLARERAMYRYRRKRALKRLVDSDYIRARGECLSITASGISALGDVVRKTQKLLETETWDHKWRIAIFDIPEIYASLRNKVRHTLKKAGFVQLQQSVWVFPHECEELVQLIKQESYLLKYILYGVLTQIENEARLKRIFRIRD